MSKFFLFFFCMELQCALTKQCNSIMLIKALLIFSFEKLRETNQNIEVESKYVDFANLLFKGLIYKNCLSTLSQSSQSINTAYIFIFFNLKKMYLIF